MESSKSPGSELWEVDLSEWGRAENRAVTASREDQASGDSCSSVRRQPAAAWETGQGQAGWARPPQALSLSWQIQIVGAGSGWRLDFRFHATLTVSLVNAEQMGHRFPWGQLWAKHAYMGMYRGDKGLPYRRCMGSSAHSRSLTPLHTQG